MQDKNLNLFSLKILIHKISLTKLAFKNDEVILQKPGFKIKFVDFPHMIIMSRCSLYIEDFSNKENFMSTKKEEVKTFGKGKSVFLNANYNEMVEYLDKYALIIQFKDFKHQHHQTIGKCLLNMDMFIKDVKYVISDEIERFRRNTFKLSDNDNNCVGWFDMSISVLQRPVSCITKMISKKLGSFEGDINVQKQKPSEIQKKQKDKILIQDNYEETKKKQSDEINENEDTYKVVVMKAGSLNKDEEEDLSDSSVLKISEFQGPEKLTRRKSQSSLETSQKQNRKNSGQLQIIKQTSKEGAAFGQENFKNLANNNQQSADEYYIDDFEVSNFQTSVQQQSSSHNQPQNQKSKGITQKSQQKQNDETYDNYDEDFDSVSGQSYSLSVPKKQGQNDRKRQNQFELSSSRQEEAISEVYTEDFENMSLSQSQPKPKNQLKPIRR